VTDEQNAREGIDGTVLPAEIDPTKPSIARVYDYMIGGKQHFAIDREVSKALFRAVPEVPQLGRCARTTMLRSVRWLVAEAGIDQVVDLGSGLPTAGNVHEIALECNPDTRVVYVDNDAIVLAHARALLANHEHVTVIQADIRDVDDVFANPGLLRLIDLDRPFAVVAAGILHHLSDEAARATTKALRAKLSPGSYLMSANFLDDDEPRAKQLERAFIEGGLGTGRFRTWAELAEFFEGLEMVEPGLVYANDWRPDSKTPRNSPVQTLYATGIGRKPAG
jgi:O-methyltransferase involved in polyketide biosynthesis